jgi:sulfite exporter TauE/SafE
MTKPESSKPYSLIGIVFGVAGVVILVLALLNYLQDGRISLTIVMGPMIILLGLLLYSQGKRRKDQGG